MQWTRRRPGIAILLQAGAFLVWGINRRSLSSSLLSGSLPPRFPIFPLAGALLLPGGNLPLNIFEPRYLQMTRDAMRTDRVIGMIQPTGQGRPERPETYDLRPARLAL
jgi:hypothetical protein